MLINSKIQNIRGQKGNFLQTKTEVFPDGFGRFSRLNSNSFQTVSEMISDKDGTCFAVFQTKGEYLVLFLGHFRNYSRTFP